MAHIKIKVLLTIYEDIHDCNTCTLSLVHVTTKHIMILLERNLSIVTVLVSFKHRLSIKILD